jgi:hypothetical protein
MGGLLEAALGQLHALKSGLPCACPSDADYAAGLAGPGRAAGAGGAAPPPGGPEEIWAHGGHLVHAGGHGHGHGQGHGHGAAAGAGHDGLLREYEEQLVALERADADTGAGAGAGSRASGSGGGGSGFLPPTPPRSGGGGAPPPLPSWATAPAAAKPAGGDAAGAPGVAPSGGGAPGGPPQAGMQEYGYGGLDDAWWARPATSVDPVTDLPDFLRPGPVAT